jgi:hypothetical protein
LGYTHYWYQDPKLDADKFAAAALDIAKVVEMSKVSLGGGMGGAGTAPEIGPEKIRLNGIEGDAHETFAIEPTAEKPSYQDQSDPKVFNFCKTDRKPYDEVVTASLAVLKHHLGDAIRVSSDGDFSDWSDGLALAGEATNLDLSALMQTELEQEE